MNRATAHGHQSTTGVAVPALRVKTTVREHFYHIYADKEVQVTRMHARVHPHLVHHPISSAPAHMHLLESGLPHAASYTLRDGDTRVRHAHGKRQSTAAQKSTATWKSYKPPSFRPPLQPLSDLISHFTLGVPMNFSTVGCSESSVVLLFGEALVSPASSAASTADEWTICLPCSLWTKWASGSRRTGMLCHCDGTSQHLSPVPS